MRNERKTKVYYGKAKLMPGGIRVWVIEGTERRILPSYYKEVKHSSGFRWGYGGSGPSQLAYAILRDHLKDRDKACRLYQRFKWDVIAKIPQHEDLMIDGSLIEKWLRSVEHDDSV